MHSRARGHETDGLRGGGDTHARAYTHLRSFAYATGADTVRHAGVRAYALRLEVAAKVTASSVRELLHVGFLGHVRLISQGYIFRVSFPRARTVVVDEAAGTRWPGWYKPGIHRVIP